MLSYFETDLNCPSCFNRVLDALSAAVGVDHVEGHSSNSCISVEHRVEESMLRSIITLVGRTNEVADNAEFVMGVAHSEAHASCSCGQSVEPSNDASGVVR